ncbi:hypothetical protein ACHAWU_000068 [Discostella pseudostelligera]|uniref:Steroid 5-alpha reductase C-terminal domain-containing protein n=1 Tax=Discostella pseudostelligera TaxID=259834 RepID=A0ABD3MC05_9STRA
MAKTSFLCRDDYSFRSIIHGEYLDDDDTDSNPYRWAFIVCHFIAFLTFSVSSITGNMSQVDKLWSILPTIYAWMCVVDSRTLLMAILSTMWSIRLSYNFYRRGGYTWPPWRGEEDYRWECLRRGMLGGWWALLTNQYIWVVFNIFFISLYQNYLLLYIASPSLIAWSVAMKEIHCQTGEGEDNGLNSTSLNMLDGIASALLLTFLLLETIADNQQLRFQNDKKVWKASIENSGGFANAIKMVTSRTSLSEYKDGFCQSGLFAIIRKPAYACEQGIWISYYLFSVAAVTSTGGGLWNWSSGGFILLCLLFKGSGWLTEQISISKYPAYREYKKKVPLYLPKLSTLWKLIRRCR